MCICPLGQSRRRKALDTHWLADIAERERTGTCGKGHFWTISFGNLTFAVFAEHKTRGGWRIHHTARCLWGSPFSGQILLWCGCRTLVPTRSPDGSRKRNGWGGGRLKNGYVASTQRQTWPHERRPRQCRSGPDRAIARPASHGGVNLAYIKRLL